MRQKPESLQEYIDMMVARLSGWVGNHRLVIRKLERLYSHRIESVALHRRLGDAYYATGELAEAYDHWQRCLRINPHEWEVRRKIEDVEGELVRKNASLRGGAQQELFLRNIPEELKSGKTGLAIAFVADENVAGIVTTLMHAINRFTPHSARVIIGKSNFINYEQDLILARPEDREEAREVVAGADFYHIGRVAPNFLDVHFDSLLSPRNCVFQYYGSELRKNGARIREFHQRTGIRAISYPEWAVVEQMPDAFIVNTMIDTSIYPQMQNQSEKPFLIAHSPTARAVKSTDFFLEVLKNLAQEYPVEPLLIEGLPFQESLRKRSTAHMTFDQIHLGMYGVSSLEALCMKQPVLCGLNSFLFYFLPDIPIIPVTHNTLGETIIHLLHHPEQRKEIGEHGFQWVENHHSMTKLIPRYMFIYDMIINGVRKISFAEKTKMLGFCN